MERLVKVVSLFFAAVFFLPAITHAEEQISDQDCQSILEAYAVAPKTVAPDVVKACQEIVAAAPALSALASAVDCTAPGSTSSVQCWGDWASLSPASDSFDPGGDNIIEFDDRDLLEGPLVAGIDTGPDPTLPIGACSAGLSCGGSITFQGNVTANPVGADGVIQPFQLNTDPVSGNLTSFTADPGGNAIQSEQFSIVNYIFNPVTGLYNTVAFDGTFDSLLVARTNCSPCDGVNGETTSDIFYSADIWSNEDANGVDTNGRYAWGVAVTQAELDAFNDVDRQLVFEGAMSVDNGTNALVTLQYGGTPSFTGNFTGNNEFDVSGSLSGPNFFAETFSGTDIVQNDANVVQGTVVGQDSQLGDVDSNLGAIILVDVETTGGIYRDVGALPENVTP